MLFDLFSMWEVRSFSGFFLLRDRKLEFEKASRARANRSTGLAEKTTQKNVAPSTSTMKSFIPCLHRSSPLILF